jgi:hypothetical protein
MIKPAAAIHWPFQGIGPPPHVGGYFFNGLLGRVPMSGLWRTARYLVFAGGTAADGPEWRGKFLPESLFTVFPSRFAGAVRSSPRFQRFSSAREAPS